MKIRITDIQNEMQYQEALYDYTNRRLNFSNWEQWPHWHQWESSNMAPSVNRASGTPWHPQSKRSGNNSAAAGFDISRWISKPLSTLQYSTQKPVILDTYMYTHVTFAFCDAAVFSWRFQSLAKLATVKRYDQSTLLEWQTTLRQWTHQSIVKLEHSLVSSQGPLTCLSQSAQCLSDVHQTTWR